MIKPIIDRWVSYPCFQKFMNVSFIADKPNDRKPFINISVPFSQKI